MEVRQQLRSLVEEKGWELEEERDKRRKATFFDKISSLQLLLVSPIRIVCYFLSIESYRTDQSSERNDHQIQLLESGFIMLKNQSQILKELVFSITFYPPQFLSYQNFNFYLFNLLNLDHTSHAETGFSFVSFLSLSIDRFSSSKTDSILHSYPQLYF